MSSARRLIEVLALFSLKSPTWTVAAAAETLGLSRASAYRYFLLLAEAGYINEVAGHQYVLGARIVELDRQIRLGDPLIQVALDEMAKLAKATGGVALLCRLYNERVLCIHQERGERGPGFVSYERGRAMPLYRGATSKVILAFMPVSDLSAVIKHHHEEKVRSELPSDPNALYQMMEPIRKERLCVTYEEVDPHRCGVAVPICQGSRPIGSLSVVLLASEAKGRLLKTAKQLLSEAGVRIEAELEPSGTKKPKRKPRNE